MNREDGGLRLRLQPAALCAELLLCSYGLVGGGLFPTWVAQFDLADLNKNLPAHTN